MWTKRQKMTRSAIRTRLAVWAASGLSVQWVNLTSSPRSKRRLLNSHFAALRRAMEDRLTVPVEYCGVRTAEGHGVIHALMAAKVLRGKAWSTVCSQVWLSEAWARLHGAPIVWIEGLKNPEGAARYMVTQYMAHGQGDALERFFQSRQLSWPDMNVPNLRRLLWALVGKEWRLVGADEHFSFALAGEYQARMVRRVRLFRQKWAELLRQRWVELDGVRYVAFANGLEME